jgi:hypothetical protein
VASIAGWARRPGPAAHGGIDGLDAVLADPDPDLEPGHCPPEVTVTVPWRVGEDGDVASGRAGERARRERGSR